MRSILADGLSLAGLLLFSFGLYMAWPPLGVIAAGAALYIVGQRLNGRTS